MQTVLKTVIEISGEHGTLRYPLDVDTAGVAQLTDEALIRIGQWLRANAPSLDVSFYRWVDLGNGEPTTQDIEIPVADWIVTA